MAKKKDRTIYDLQAWEMLTDYPELVMTITSKRGDIILVEPCKNVSFTVYRANVGCIFNIVTFAHWIRGFNKHHGTDFTKFDEVRDFYREGGALHW